jgi:hypothetical protein
MTSMASVWGTCSDQGGRLVRLDKFGGRGPLLGKFARKCCPKVRVELTALLTCWESITKYSGIMKIRDFLCTEMKILCTISIISQVWTLFVGIFWGADALSQQITRYGEMVLWKSMDRTHHSNNSLPPHLRSHFAHERSLRFSDPGQAIEACMIQAHTST